LPEARRFVTDFRRRGETVRRLKQSVLVLLAVFAVAQLIRPDRTNPPLTRTLRYDWFLSSDGTECEVRESYTSAEGLIEHNTHILEARNTLFKDYADNHFMTVYGDPTPELLALVKTHHLEHQFKWFSFVRGLDSSSI
jgi:hypothetical protein